MSCGCSFFRSFETRLSRLNLIVNPISRNCFLGGHAVFLFISFDLQNVDKLTSTFLATWMFDVMMALPPAAPPIKIGLPSFSTIYGQLELKGRFRPFTTSLADFKLASADLPKFVGEGS
jgi:hypothetical protein